MFALSIFFIQNAAKNAIINQNLRQFITFESDKLFQSDQIFSFSLNDGRDSANNIYGNTSVN